MSGSLNYSNGPYDRAESCDKPVDKTPRGLKSAALCLHSVRFYSFRRFRRGLYSGSGAGRFFDVGAWLFLEGDGHLDTEPADHRVAGQDKPVQMLGL